MKTCKKCSLTKTLDNFTKSSSTKDQLRNWCRDCFAQYDKERYLVKPREYLRGKSLVRYWPSSTAQEALQKYEELYTKQGGLCAICERPEAVCGTLNVDHDHSTGRVRGLLCRTCNRGLGEFRDLISDLEAAISYLRNCDASIQNHT